MTKVPLPFWSVGAWTPAEWDSGARGTVCCLVQDGSDGEVQQCLGIHRKVQTQALPQNSSVCRGRYHPHCSATPRAGQTHSGLNPSLAKLPVVTVPGQAPVPVGLGLLMPFGAERKTGIVCWGLRVIGTVGQGEAQRPHVQPSPLRPLVSGGFEGSMAQPLGRERAPAKRVGWGGGEGKRGEQGGRCK